MSKTVISTLSYFAQFNYPASIELLHLFHPHTISKPLLQKKIDALVQRKDIRTIVINGEKRYYLSSNRLNNYVSRYALSTYLISQTEQHLSLFELVPMISYMGISGSLSMLNAAHSSDIDLFIITSPGTQWMVRCIVLLYKKIQCVINPTFGSKLCINLIFAQNGLKIGKKKQNEYIGHEILQLKSVFNKSQTYEIMLSNNKWILTFFPNVHINSSLVTPYVSLSKQFNMISLFERFVRMIQIWWLDRKGYTFSERGNQLWLIQKDYEVKLRR
ncbi:MAG: hypothetical protein O3B87_01000 [bacterium]|nr:hypothetical protein [bacterium]